MIGGGLDKGGGMDTVNTAVPEAPDARVNVWPNPFHSRPFHPLPHESIMCSVQVEPMDTDAHAPPGPRDQSRPP
jgi:hypothetical protein